jgi:RISC-loading complex subunit TARBP2
MLKRLQSQPVENDSDAFLAIDDDDLAQGIAQKNRELKSKNMHHLMRFYKNLKPKEGSALAKLQDYSSEELSQKSSAKLEDISKEEDFTVTYVPLEEKNKVGKYNCLVQMSTTPVAVCFGSADTRDLAKEAAALNALEYLRIMTK